MKNRALLPVFFAFLSVVVLGAQGSVAAQDRSDQQSDFPACDTVAIPASGPLVTCLSESFAVEAAAWFAANPDQIFYAKPDGDIFYFAYKGDAEFVRFCCDIQTDMIEDKARGLWHAGFAGRELREMTIDEPGAAVDNRLIFEPERTNIKRWEGPRYVGLPEPGEANIIEHRLYDEATGQRDLFIHIPERLKGKHDAEIELVYVADGYMLSENGKFVHLLQAAGGNDNRVFVGVGASQSLLKTNPNPYSRNDEYLFDPFRRRFDGYLAFERFFLNEILSDVEQGFLSDFRIKKRYLMGVSSGAAWAFSTAARNQHIFDGAYMISPVNRTVARYAGNHPVRPDFDVSIYYGSVGESEAVQAPKIYCGLKKQGLTPALYELAGGHSGDVSMKAFIHASRPDYGVRYVREKLPDCS